MKTTKTYIAPPHILYGELSPVESHRYIGISFSDNPAYRLFSISITEVNNYFADNYHTNITPYGDGFCHFYQHPASPFAAPGDAGETPGHPGMTPRNLRVAPQNLSATPVQAGSAPAYQGMTPGYPGTMPTYPRFNSPTSGNGSQRWRKHHQGTENYGFFHPSYFSKNIISHFKHF